MEKKLKCKYCKKENIKFMINAGFTKKENFKKTGEIYICEDCGKCTIFKINLK